MRRGEIRWYTFRAPNKRRPVLILTRDEVLENLNEIIVAPATRTIRGLATEVVLSEEDGMLVASTAQEGLIRVVEPQSRKSRSDHRLQV